MDEDDPLSLLLPQILEASAGAACWAMGNLRANEPEFKVPYSTSKLNGLERVQEHLDHDNVNKMNDVYGMSRDAFEGLADELGLQDSKHVAKEEKLAMFLQTVRHSASLRAIQDGSQRAKSTESECIKEVLALLVEKNGFYGRYVKMPNERSACPPQLEREGYEEFRACIGAIDGTHLNITSVPLLYNNNFVLLSVKLVSVLCQMCRYRKGCRAWDWLARLSGSTS